VWMKQRKSVDRGPRGGKRRRKWQLYMPSLVCLLLQACFPYELHALVFCLYLSFKNKNRVCLYTIGRVSFKNSTFQGHPGKITSQAHLYEHLTWASSWLGASGKTALQLESKGTSSILQAICAHQWKPSYVFYNEYILL
jgi:hypothetical protein